LTERLSFWENLGGKLDFLHSQSPVVNVQLSIEKFQIPPRLLFTPMALL